MILKKKKTINIILKLILLQKVTYPGICLFILEQVMNIIKLLISIVILFNFFIRLIVDGMNTFIKSD